MLPHIALTVSGTEKKAALQLRIKPSQSRILMHSRRARDVVDSVWKIYEKSRTTEDQRLYCDVMSLLSHAYFSAA